MEAVGIQNAKHLSLKRLSVVAGKDDVDGELLAALNILANIAPPLLSVAACLHFNEVEFDLEPDDIDEILRDDSVPHPITGEIIREASKYTEFYYAVSEGISDN
ncbi:hypothetical protein [Maritimibacter alkaliphilus]|uniref:hypothetical protein n=1 Tax=Maritimibacter alkaliphilus TaxID=404236 RepID=UPI001C9846E9|nr:hypothetical protein [Maritimibacter alkaliphilus]MBY6088962.1 hypothetical protein [Maritimibacter alkaliphilus]